MKRILTAFMLSIMICGLLLVGNFSFKTAQASTPENGEITQNTTWTKTNSPYTFTGLVSVAQGVTLTIDPGVTVNLGSYDLEVKGTLSAQGTASEKIFFNSDGENILLPSNNPTIKFENAVLDQTSIDGQSSFSVATVTITSCSLEGNSAVNVWGITTISKCYVTGAVLLRGASTLSGSTFLNGIDIAGNSSGNSFTGTYTISNNHITNQMGSYVINAGSRGTISGNTISGGCIAGICQADGFSTLSATIENNLIIYNENGIVTRTDEDDSIIRDNTIINNTIGIRNPTPLQTITGNSFEGNSHYNIEAGLISATAQNNWWGTADNSEVSGTIRDSRDDYTLGTIAYEPFLTAPNPDAPTVPADFSTSALTASTPTPNTHSPTATATSQSGNDTNQPLNWKDTGMYALLAVIGVIVAAILVAVLRNRAKKKRNAKTAAP
jgi:hypothetical protein